MNLSKDELVNLLYSVGTEWCSYEDYKEKIRSAAVAEALKDGTLDVEGYERVQWKRFDSCKEDTYPAKLTPILAFGFPNPDNSLVPEFFVCQLSVMCDFISKESYDAKVLFWRPLPKPPIGTE